MRYYDKDFFYGKNRDTQKKSDFGQEKALEMARIILRNSKEKPLISIKTFFPKNFKEGILKEQKDALLNAAKVYDSRRKIIKLFEDKNIKPNDYPYNAKSEPDDECDRVKEFEPEEFEESILEGTKIRIQKKSDENDTVNELNKLVIEKDNIINRDLNFKFKYQSVKVLLVSINFKV